jgi:small nuclear ribonucleoprotein (snRNP)-like protein
MASVDVEEANNVLNEYIGKTLRVHTDDNRIFVGQMKCTDRVSTTLNAPIHDADTLKGM